jgi:hypothetical protein
MQKEKVIIIGSAFLILLVLFIGVRKMRSLQAQIGEQKENVEKSSQRLEHLRDLEESLEFRRETGRVLCQIPRAEDPIASKVLMGKFVKSFLSRLGLEAVVKVENERKSRDFPDVVTITEVPLKIGIRNYSSYDQVMKLLKEFRNFPFVIEVLTIGGTDVAVPGILRVQLKYYAVPGGA